MGRQIPKIRPKHNDGQVVGAHGYAGWLWHRYTYHHHWIQLHQRGVRQLRIMHMELLSSFGQLVSGAPPAAWIVVLIRSSSDTDSSTIKRGGWYGTECGQYMLVMSSKPPLLAARAYALQSLMSPTISEPTCTPQTTLYGEGGESEDACMRGNMTERLELPPCRALESHCIHEKWHSSFEENGWRTGCLPSWLPRETVSRDSPGLRAFMNSETDRRPKGTRRSIDRLLQSW